MKKMLLASVCLFVSTVLFAQIEVGLGGHLAKFSKSNGGESFIGPGLIISYAPYESRSNFFGGFNYYMPKKNPGSVTAYRQTAGSPQSIQVGYDTKTTLYVARLGGNFMFVGDNSTDFGFYGGAEGALALYGGKNKYESYDTENYSLNEESKQSGSQLMIGFHIGLQKMAGSGFAFLEAGYRFPATEYNSRYGYITDIEVPAHLAASIGYKITLGAE